MKKKTDAICVLIATPTYSESVGIVANKKGVAQWGYEKGGNF